MKRNRGSENSVEHEILASLAEFTAALEQGEIVQRLTRKQIALSLRPVRYTPQRVKETRKLLRLSQSLFAHFLGVSPQTVRSWEQGTNTPQPVACRFMDEIRHAPHFWLERLREVAVSAGG